MDSFLLLIGITRWITIAAGLLLVLGGVALLWGGRNRLNQPGADVDVDTKQGRISLKGAVPAVILIVLGGAAIIFAVMKPITFEQRQPDGTVLTGTGGPDSGLRHLPALLDTLVRNSAASPEGMPVTTDLGGFYYPVEVVGRAWSVEQACERTLEYAMAGDSALRHGKSAPSVGGAQYYFPAMLDTLVRGASASSNGLLIDERRSQSESVMHRARRVVAACEQVMTTDASGTPVTLLERVRKEGPR